MVAVAAAVADERAWLQVTRCRPQTLPSEDEADALATVLVSHDVLDLQVVDTRVEGH